MLDYSAAYAIMCSLAMKVALVSTQYALLKCIITISPSHCFRAIDPNDIRKTHQANNYWRKTVAILLCLLVANVVDQRTLRTLPTLFFYRRPFDSGLARPLISTWVGPIDFWAPPTEAESTKQTQVHSNRESETKTQKHWSENQWKRLYILVVPSTVRYAPIIGLWRLDKEFEWIYPRSCFVVCPPEFPHELVDVLIQTIGQNV